MQEVGRQGRVERMEGMQGTLSALRSSWLIASNAAPPACRDRVTHCDILSLRLIGALTHLLLVFIEAF